MPMARRTRAAGPLLLGGAAASWCLAATAFVSTHGPAPGALRGAGAGAELRPFAPQPPHPAAQAGASLSWASVASLAAALGLLSGVASRPVWAEEAAPAAAAAATTQLSAKEEAAIDAQKRAAAPTKEDRVKADLEALSKERDLAEIQSSVETRETGGGQIGRGYTKKKSTRKVLKAEQPQAKDEGGFSLPSLSLPSFTAPAQEVVKQKVIISPANELDEDELPLTRPNLPLFIVGIFGPTAIYLVFYVLGSLEVI